MVESAGDFIGFEALQVETHGLNPMSEARTDVLLLSARGDFDLAFT
jgi:hypothetical protein